VSTRFPRFVTDSWFFEEGGSELPVRVGKSRGLGRGEKYKNKNRKERCTMKFRTATLVLFVAIVMMVIVAPALAMEMTGVVTAVDVEKSSITLKTEKMDVSMDCEIGSLLKDIKEGDTVTVQYSEEGGKKLATSVTRVAPMK
jgi:Cu/Ag efflux protein CusF